VAVRFPGRPETYELNFLEGSQTNGSSGQRRPIRRLAGALRLAPPSPPLYWKRQSGQFHEVESSKYVLDMAQELLRKTHRDVRSRDRAGAVPAGFLALEARRVEDSELWRRYAQKCHEVQAKGGCRGLRVKTTEELRGAAKSELNASVNEVYLFHGTSLESAGGIARAGFRIDLAGSKVGAAYGRGAYFAERSTKSDEYAQPDAEGRCTMLLCRVCLGEVYRLQEFDTHGERHVLESKGQYNSLLGDGEARAGTFQEFVLYEASQIYPEYLIVYKRCHCRSPACVACRRA